MKNRNVIITGGNAGIGFETARVLAQMGANIYIVSRDETKAQNAVQQLIAATQNNNIYYFIADLSSQKAIHKLTAEIKQKLDKIDVLLNNAGGVFPEFRLSEDGLEMTIATNHFSSFLLTNLLLDLVKKSDYARIITVSSGSHYRGVIDFESFTKEKSYFIMKAYEQSKLANVLFTFELANRLKGTHVTANCLHPGFVHTHIGNKGTQWYASLLWSLSTRLGGLSVEAGAKTSIYLASSDEVKGVTGKYFEKCKVKEPSKSAQDVALQKELWKRSEMFCPLG